MGGRARRRREPEPDHADDDREHRDVVASPGPLAEHPLGEEHEHEQPRREGRLDDDERGEQQGDDLEREAEDREPRAGEPAGPLHELAGQAHAQMVSLVHLAGVEGLQRNP